MMTDTVLAAQPGRGLLAEDARTARRPGWCAVCRRAVIAGDRVADLADGSGLVHVARCSATAAGASPRVPESAAGRRRGSWRGRTAP